MRWLMIGTSPTVLQTLPIARQQGIGRIITCNGGLGVVPTPDVYIATDQIACQKYAPAARQAQQHGTRCVTLLRQKSALRDRDCHWYDEFLELGTGEPTAATWGCFQYTGPQTLEYALRNGATSVVMAGCDGYRYCDGNDYFDNQTLNPRPDGDPQQRTQCMARRYLQLARLFPVPIIQYGDPVFDIDAPNWRKAECPQPS